MDIDNPREEIIFPGQQAIFQSFAEKLPQGRAQQTKGKHYRN
jgi:hypothetical protein